MTTYNYGITSMQKTYNSRLECPQGRDLKTVSHIPYILCTAADDGSADHAIMFSIQCRVEICDRCTIHLAASSVSSASNSTSSIQIQLSLKYHLSHHLSGLPIIYIPLHHLYYQHLRLRSQLSIPIFTRIYHIPELEPLI
jgi:hypothetical protein